MKGGFCIANSVTALSHRFDRTGFRLIAHPIWCMPRTLARRGAGKSEVVHIRVRILCANDPRYGPRPLRLGRPEQASDGWRDGERWSMHVPRPRFGRGRASGEAAQLGFERELPRLGVA
jgi:hypothetical protein